MATTASQSGGVIQFNLFVGLILYLYKIKLGEELPPYGINERLRCGGVGEWGIMLLWYTQHGDFRGFWGWEFDIKNTVRNTFFPPTSLLHRTSVRPYSVRFKRTTFPNLPRVAGSGAIFLKKMPPLPRFQLKIHPFFEPTE